MKRLGALFGLCLLLGCRVSADANAAVRCSGEDECEPAQICSHGFCVRGAAADDSDAGLLTIDPGKPVAHDAGSGLAAEASVEVPEASVEVQEPNVEEPAEPDAGETPPETPTPEVPTTPKPPPGGTSALQCAGNQSLCGDKCVKLLEDSKHCGACGHPCQKGPCKAGICEKDEDEEHD